MNLLEIFPHVIELKDLMIVETLETIKMTLVAGVISAVIGLILAIGLVVTKKNGLKENRIIYSILSGVINLLRAIPFVILLFALIPLTRILVGTTIGFVGSIVPLVFSTAPFFARQFETAMLEVDDGVIEAAISMGASNIEIIRHVYLGESVGGLIRASVITLVNLLGLTTMVGAIAGGGIGNFSLMYGFRRNWLDVTYVSVIIILVLVYIIQLSGNLAIKIFVKGENKNEKISSGTIIDHIAGWLRFKS